MKFLSVAEVIKRSGLRLVLVQGAPSPWGQAVKAMMEYKGLEFVVAPQIPGAENADLVAWAGVNSGPVVAWNDGRPLNRWNDILFLLERLAPQRPLVPDAPAERVQLLGLSHELCGELGLGWNRRLSLFKPAIQSGQAPSGITAMSRKYGYNESDVAATNQRQIEMLNLLSSILDSQRAKGSAYFVGAALSAVDFYWAAFSVIMDILPDTQCPVAAGARSMFENIDSNVKAAISPQLLEHRERILRAHFKLPMEF
jgi:glutathione S-transferase